MEAFNIHTRGTLRSVHELGEGIGHVRFRPSFRCLEMTVVLSRSALQTFLIALSRIKPLPRAPHVPELRPLEECST